VSLIDRTRGASPEDIWTYRDRRLTNIVFKTFTYTNSAEVRAYQLTTVLYDKITITAPSDRVLWILGIRFYRESRIDGGCCAESRIQYGDNPMDGYASTNSKTYVSLLTHHWAGFMVPPDFTITINIWLRSSDPNYSAFMRNVRIDILYMEVIL